MAPSCNRPQLIDRLTYRGQTIEVYERNQTFWAYINGRFVNGFSGHALAVDTCEQHIDAGNLDRFNHDGECSRQSV